MIILRLFFCLGISGDGRISRNLIICVTFWTSDQLTHYPTEPNAHYLIYEFPQKLSYASAFARLVIINLKAEVWKCQESCVIL